MTRFARARLGPLVMVLVIAAVAAAVVMGVSKLGYPTTATYPESSEDAGAVEEVPGSDIPQVRVSAEAAEKIGLRTTQVTASVGGVPAAGKAQLSIPYAAVFYDPEGGTWAYVAKEPLVFQRQAVAVVSIGTGGAVLSAGPPAGTQVVTAGSALLYGIEVGVEEE